MSLRDKIEHAIQNQPCMVKDLKAKFGGDRSADRKVMEALDELVHDAVVCQKSGVFFTARSGRAEKALLCKVVKLGKNFAFVMLEDESGDLFLHGLSIHSHNQTAYFLLNSAIAVGPSTIRPSSSSFSPSITSFSSSISFMVRS